MNNVIFNGRKKDNESELKNHSNNDLTSIISSEPLDMYIEDDDDEDENTFVKISQEKCVKIIDNTFINHYGNDGEIKIKYDYNNSKYTKVDGYSKKLNKIYEFHGDFWHGNPKKYDKGDINCFSKKCKKKNSCKTQC